MDINIDDYKILNLSKDPFSTAPDPEFLYQSRQHFGTLQLLECAIKKEKGMSVVLGLPGTGKTSICRQLYRKMSFVENVSARIVYASYYENSEQLIRDIANAFDFTDFTNEDDIFEIFTHNYQEDRKTIALIIDNGHMIPEFCLSVLNRLSDLKSNGEHFFKVAVFANKEFSSNIDANPDFKSRITHYRILGPFNFRDTRQMITYRLKMAGSGISQSSKTGKIFSLPAMYAIYLATGGYPRKIVVLCHRCIVTMLLNKTIRAGWFLVRSNAKRVLRNRRLIPEPVIATSIMIIPLLIAAFTLGIMNDKDFTNYIKALNHVIANISVNRTVETQEKIPTMKEKVEIVDESDRLIFPDIDISEKLKDEGLPVKSDDNVTSLQEKPGLEKSGEKVPAVEQPEVPVVKKERDLIEIIPELLGFVEVKRSDTLLAMLESVYGHSRKRYKTPVIEANQHISNIDSLEIGQKINFPTIVAEFERKDREHYWVKITSAEKLNDAVNFKRKWPLKRSRLKIIPYFTSEKGLQFEIVHKKLYQSKGDALSFIKTLPPSVQKEVPAIIVFPFNKAVFFANPYLM